MTAAESQGKEAVRERDSKGWGAVGGLPPASAGRQSSELAAVPLLGEAASPCCAGPLRRAVAPPSPWPLGAAPSLRPHGRPPPLRPGAESLPRSSWKCPHHAAASAAQSLKRPFRLPPAFSLCAWRSPEGRRCRRCYCWIPKTTASSVCGR